MQNNGFCCTCKHFTTAAKSAIYLIISNVVPALASTVSVSGLDSLPNSDPVKMLVSVWVV
jgi:hypothetical protein